MGKMHPATASSTASPTQELHEIPSNLCEENAIFSNLPLHHCTDCNCVYTTAEKLEQHRVNAHGTVGEFSCVKCGKRFARSTNLYLHVRFCQRTNEIVQVRRSREI